MKAADLWNCSNQTAVGVCRRSRLGRALVQGKVRAALVVQLDSPTPTLPLSGGYFTTGTLGRGASLSFIVLWRRRATRLRDAVLLAKRRVSALRCRFGCLIGRPVPRPVSCPALGSRSQRFRPCRHYLAEVNGAGCGDRLFPSPVPVLSADSTSCDQNRGDEHAPSPGEGNPARVVRFSGQRHDSNAGMAEFAAPDATDDHRLDGAIVDGARPGTENGARRRPRPGGNDRGRR